MGIDRHGIVGQPIGWFEQYRCPGNGAILGCHVWTGDIVHQSIALGPSRSEAYFQAIADGQIHDPRYLPQVMAAHMTLDKIGSASCRERVCQYVYISVVAVSL